MSKKFNPKKCRICGKTFIPKSGRQVKCPDCKNKKVECAECGKTHKPHTTNANGEPICNTCYINLRESVECVVCGKIHKPNYTNSNGEPICQTCYNSIKLRELYDSTPVNERPSEKHLAKILGIHQKREIEC